MITEVFSFQALVSTIILMFLSSRNAAYNYFSIKTLHGSFHFSRLADFFNSYRQLYAKIWVSVRLRGFKAFKTSDFEAISILARLSAVSAAYAGGRVATNIFEPYESTSPVKVAYVSCQFHIILCRSAKE